jgi:hypothetical protein
MPKPHRNDRFHCRSFHRCTLESLRSATVAVAISVCSCSASPDASDENYSLFFGATQTAPQAPYLANIDGPAEGPADLSPAEASVTLPNHSERLESARKERSEFEHSQLLLAKSRSTAAGIVSIGSRHRIQDLVTIDPGVGPELANYYNVSANVLQVLYGTLAPTISFRHVTSSCSTPMHDPAIVLLAERDGKYILVLHASLVDGNVKYRSRTMPLPQFIEELTHAP